MRVMLDNSILGHCQFAEPMGLTLSPPGGVGTTYLHGWVRRKDHSDRVYQSEIDAIFAVGRLIREERIFAFTYNELSFEGWKRSIGESAFDAFAGCAIAKCQNPIERSRFRQTFNFMDYASKGGKDDRKQGRDTAQGQVGFIEWLIGLSDQQVNTIIEKRDLLNLSPFEVESLRHLPWLRRMCRSSHSPENYPDMLHVWAAQRNRMDVFLTLEKRLPNIVASFPKKTKFGPQFPTQVIRPIELLRRLGVDAPGSAPIKQGWFYPIVGEPFKLTDSLLEQG